MAANVGAPVLAPRCDAGATPWQFVHHVSARCRPAAASPISLSDAPGQDPATTRATRRTWFGAWCHRSWCLAPRLGCQHGETWLFCRHRSRSMGLSIAQGSANRQNKGTDHVRTGRSCPGWGPLPRIANPRETSISLPIFHGGRVTGWPARWSRTARSHQPSHRRTARRSVAGRPIYCRT